MKSKERLVILSDLWGVTNSEWLTQYTQVLEPHFEVVYYDSCEIGGVKQVGEDQESVHSQLVNGGIDAAVEKLQALEKSPIHILAFSVGGTIAWKFALLGGRFKSLTCVSSTRLRKETKSPQGNIKLYFAENDPYAPSMEWLESMQVEVEVMHNMVHEMYRESSFAELCCKNLIP